MRADQSMGMVPCCRSHKSNIRLLVVDMDLHPDKCLLEVVVVDSYRLEEEGSFVEVVVDMDLDVAEVEEVDMSLVVEEEEDIHHKIVVVVDIEEEVVDHRKNRTGLDSMTCKQRKRERECECE